MKGNRKLLSLVLALLLALGSLGALADAAAEPEPTGEPPIAEGTGWSLAADGRMTVTAEARLSYANRADAEWYDYMDRIFVVDVGEGVESVGTYAFCDAVNLRRVNLPDGLKRVGLRAFSHCETLQALALPESVELIDYWAFAGCNALEEVVLGGSLEQLDNYNFTSCQGLLRAVIGEPVTRLGYDTLEKCAALRELYLPASLTIIDKFALRGCDALSDIYFAGSEEQWQAIRVEEGNEDVLARATVHYDSPWGSVPAAHVSALRQEQRKDRRIDLCGVVQLTFSRQDYYEFTRGLLDDLQAELASANVDRDTMERFLEENYDEILFLPRGATFDNTPCYMLCKVGTSDFDGDESLARLLEQRPDTAQAHLDFFEERFALSAEPEFVERGGMTFALYRETGLDMYITVQNGFNFLLGFYWFDGSQAVAQGMEEDVMANIDLASPEEGAVE